MPIYDFQCDVCGHNEDRFVPLRDFDLVQSCPKCHCPMFRKVCAPFVQCDIPGYRSPITGEWIGSKAQRREDLRKHGKVEWEPGINEAAERKRKAREAAEDAALDYTIESTISNMPARKREALAGEMEGGLTAEVIRRATNG